MLQDPKQFTIKRSCWSYGKGVSTKILNDHGNRDCIGFLLQGAGLPDKYALNLDEPIDVLRYTEWITKLIKWKGATYYQTETCHNIIHTNDNANISLFDREAKLVNLFKSIGISLTFID